MRTTVGRFTHASGFTLLEVLVATTLLFVAVASLAGLSVMATQANAHAKTTTFAALLAARKIEELRALPWGLRRARQSAFGRRIGHLTIRRA
jgi:Tfp pilus assembly protein PilV